MARDVIMREIGAAFNSPAGRVLVVARK